MTNWAEAARNNAGMIVWPGVLVVEEGAYADLLLVEGNPLEDLKAVTHSNNLKIIVNNKKIYKSTIK